MLEFNIFDHNKGINSELKMRIMEEFKELEYFIFEVHQGLISDLSIGPDGQIEHSMMTAQNVIKDFVEFTKQRGIEERLYRNWESMTDDNGYSVDQLSLCGPFYSKNGEYIWEPIYGELNNSPQDIETLFDLCESCGIERKPVYYGFNLPDTSSLEFLYDNYIKNKAGINALYIVPRMPVFIKVDDVGMVPLSMFVE